MRAVASLGMALAALASVAAAPPPVRRTPPPDLKMSAPVTPPPRASVVTNPPWDAKPNGDDLARYYPESAMRRGVGGKAVISCTVTAQGTLEACEVVSETPPGEDFGAAALRMAKLFRMKPTLPDGAPVEGGTVRVPIVFQPPEAAPTFSMQGWITTGAPPAAPPASGRFLHVLDRATSQATDQPNTTVPGAALYVVLPEAAPVDGKVSSWTLIALDVPAGSPATYAFARQIFDCAARSVKDDGMQIFAPSGQVLGWSPGEGGWRSVDTADAFLIRSLDLMCGFAGPDVPVLPTLAATLSDAKARFAAGSE